MMWLWRLQFAEVPIRPCSDYTRAHVTGNYTSGVYIKYIYKYDIITTFELYAYAPLSKQ